MRIVRQSHLYFPFVSVCVGPERQQRRKKKKVYLLPMNYVRKNSHVLICFHAMKYLTHSASPLLVKGRFYSDKGNASRSLESY